MSKSELEAHMLRDIRALAQDGRSYVLDEVECDTHEFHATRKWRFDFAWPKYKVAVEVEGGQWLKGKKRARHFRAMGYENDCEKYNEAAILGWTVLRFTGDMVKDGRAYATLERVFPPF